MRVLLKIGIGVDFANVGRDVEEERKPPDPGEELHFTHAFDLIRQFLDRAREALEESDYAVLLLRWRGIELWVSLRTSCATDAHRQGHDE